MIEYYPLIKWTHVAAVTASILVFSVRGTLVLRDRAAWAMTAAVRYLSYGIDTLLLGAGLLLVITLPGAVFANGWLTAKLVLLLIYIVLGSLALKRARPGHRRRYFFAALATYALMFSIARSHHPLGLFWNGWG